MSTTPADPEQSSATNGTAPELAPFALKPYPKGPLCPKCSSNEVQGHSGPSGCGVDVFVYIVLMAAFAMRYSYLHDDLHYGYGWQYDGLIVALSGCIAFMLIFTLWRFFVALPGRYRCRACDHTWRH